MKFRSIFLFSILEHVMNRQIIAKNIDKVLEEGGIAFCNMSDSTTPTIVILLILYFVPGSKR